MFQQKTLSPPSAIRQSRRSVKSLKILEIRYYKPWYVFTIREGVTFYNAYITSNVMRTCNVGTVQLFYVRQLLEETGECSGDSKSVVSLGKKENHLSLHRTCIVLHVFCHCHLVCYPLKSLAMLCPWHLQILHLSILPEHCLVYCVCVYVFASERARARTRTHTHKHACFDIQVISFFFYSEIFGWYVFCDTYYPYLC
jgi:hypothetical protein